MWGKMNPYSFSVGVQTGVATVEISMEAFQQTQPRTSVYHSYTTPGYIAEAWPLCGVGIDTIPQFCPEI